MRLAFFRLFVSILIMVLFLGVLTYPIRKEKIIVQQKIPQIKIAIKISEPQKNQNLEIEKTVDNLTEIIEKADSIEDPYSDSSVEVVEEIEIKEELSEEIPYIGTHVDADSINNSDFTPPVLNLKKVFSKIIYPASMKNRNIECSFLLRVFVDEKGKVSIEIPTHIDSSFVKSVEKAFDGIKAQPALLADKAIKVTFSIPINFVLK